MHIPDGLLSPQTYLPALTVAVPLWWLALRRLRGRVGDSVLPRLAVFTALAFVLSTLMLPLPGGTSAHAIGVALLALVFGPWSAFMAYTLVLVLQAFVLGAGGVTSLPVNALAMGFVGAWTAVGVARLLTPLHRDAGVALAVVGSVLTSALLVALVLGVQPLIACSPAGSQLSFPFGLRVTLPAILLPHLFIAVAEAALTVLVLRHARRRHWIGTPA